jgi:hypothetical protein
MSKKAQTQQVFIYMMVIVVIGGLLLIGFRSINNIIDKGCEVEYTNFKSQLLQELQRNTRFGMVNEINIRSPCNYEQICFGGTNNDNAVIRASMTAGAENIFLKQGNYYEPLLKYEPLNSQTGRELCINVSGGRFNFILSGVAQGKLNASSVE